MSNAEKRSIHLIVDFFQHRATLTVNDVDVKYLCVFFIHFTSSFHEHSNKLTVLSVFSFNLFQTKNFHLHFIDNKLMDFISNRRIN